MDDSSLTQRKHGRYGRRGWQGAVGRGAIGEDSKGMERHGLEWTGRQGSKGSLWNEWEGIGRQRFPLPVVQGMAMTHRQFLMLVGAILISAAGIIVALLLVWGRVEDKFLRHESVIAAGFSDTKTAITAGNKHIEQKIDNK